MARGLGFHIHILILVLVPVAFRTTAGADGPGGETVGEVSAEAGLLRLPANAVELATLLGDRSNEQLVALMRSPRVDENVAVYNELFRRPGLSPAARREALGRLATLKGVEPDVALLDGLYTFDRISGADPELLEELGEMLIGGDRETLKPRVSTVLRVAKYGRNDVTKECGWAAYVTVTGDAPQALTYARSSTTRLTWLFRGLHRVRERQLLDGLRSDVLEIAKAHTSDTVRAAAYRGLVACDPSAESVDYLLSLVDQPPEDTPALAALAAIPVDRFPAERVGHHVEAFVSFVRRLPHDRRVLVANQVRESWEHASALVDRMPEGPERERLRAEVEGVAVRTVVLRTVRRETRFDRELVEVEAGRVVEIRLENPDDLPQNLVVIAPGSIETVGTAADAMANGEGFVPETPEVLAAIPIVQPHSEGTLVFVAPPTPGDHHFASTIAEHWREMHGVLRVLPAGPNE